MDPSEQRRKRKTILRPSSPIHNSVSHLFSVKSLVVCFSCFTLIYLFHYTIPFSSSTFHPVLVISSLSLLSSSSTSSSSASIQDSGFGSLNFLKVEDRVLFPDHVLLLVPKEKKSDGLLKKNADLDCVYSRIANKSSSEEGAASFVEQKVLSVDEYDEFRLIARCPLPPVDYSSVVNLQRRGRGQKVLELGELRTNQSLITSWDNVAYAATLDGNTAAVFVKGLNLRPYRKYDPSQFSCHFGLGNWEKDGRFVLQTKAITAAQEVVRCSLPRSIRKKPDKAQGIRVTVGMIPPRVNAKANDRVLVPSVAKIYNTDSAGRKASSSNRKKKYELCVCTMVWNQAFALREWIMYHGWLGVERWFIYDNNSDDGIKKVIEELDQEEYNVTRHVWPWIKTQEAGFSHCTLRAKDECNWVSFMDVDEFFYFPYSTPRHQSFRKLGYAGQNSLRELVANFSSSSPMVAEIRTTCHSFGPSGLNSAPSQGSTVGYTCRLQRPERHKSIIRPDALDATLLNVVHHFHLSEGFKYLNLPLSTAMINHYKYQVWEVFRAKFYRRVATYVADWTENQKEGSKDRAPGLGTEAIEPPDWSLRFCEVWDTGLRDFVLANLADRSTGLLPWERSRF